MTTPCGSGGAGYAEFGLAGLKDLPRPGRRPVFTAVQRAEVKALACTPPADSELPLARWSVAELADAAVAQGLVTSIGPTTVGRWLDLDAIKPWQYRSWIFPRDPDFAFKAGRVLDLYARSWEGDELGADEYVISADEKSQLQALRRRHPGLPPGPIHLISPPLLRVRRGGAGSPELTAERGRGVGSATSESLSPRTTRQVSRCVREIE